MSLRLANVTFDCTDALAVARFWSAALDRPLDPDANEQFATIDWHEGSRTTWMFWQVPEPKTAKNRVHSDFMTDDPTQEIARLVDLGARRVADKDEWGHQWTVMADPEGNEFCIAKAP